MERINSKREHIKANRETKDKLIKLINSITDELNLDEDRMAKRIDSALRSEYGPINGLINLVVAIAQWPAEPGDGAMVASNRLALESKFGLDLLLLDDIKQFRGFHSFVSNDLEVIEGQEPKFEDYTDYCHIFLEDLGAVAYKATIEPNTWRRREVVAREKAELEKAKLSAELDRYSSLIKQP